MESLISQKKSDDSIEAMQALETTAKILARMIVKEVMDELKTQERFFGVSDARVMSSDDAGAKRSNMTYSVEEAGKFLGISRAKAYDCARLGKIPTIRFGHRILIPKAALLKLLDDAGSFKSQPN